MAKQSLQSLPTRRSPGLRATVALGLLAMSGAASCGADHRPATWEYISPIIFQPNCATGSCHSPAAAADGMDFSDPDRGYTSLTALWVWIVDPNGTADEGCRVMDGTVVCQRPGGMVVPFNPGESRVVNALRAQNVARMPPDRPLAEGDIELVERWILNGASKVVGGPPAGTVPLPDAGVDATGAGGTGGGGAGGGGAGGAGGGGGAQAAGGAGGAGGKGAD
ncbi:MAG TPA: hypothetical protein VGP07_04910 [Polyangia bacterium]|jgi:hypothetical protein